MRIKRKVRIGEVPVIRHTDELTAAAARLATERCAYVLPASMESPDGTLTKNEQRVTALVNALNEHHPLWTANQFRQRLVIPSKDIGMHGNLPHNDYLPGVIDYLQYHHTPSGSHVVTFALDQPPYLKERTTANPLLTVALREGETYPYYADPDTFQRATIGPGDSVVFRLNDQDGSCLLHDFQTTSPLREARYIAIQRWGPLDGDVIS